ncbi:MAG: CHAT domain-containing protein, partial [Saprospiraceae bacterium]|nr:CHAT domain-containing protein [Saprospiraceae bacterium]
MSRLNHGDILKFNIRWLILLLWVNHASVILSQSEIDSALANFDRGAYQQSLPFFETAYQILLHSEDYDSLTSITLKFVKAQSATGDFASSEMLIDRTLILLREGGAASINMVRLQNSKAFTIRALGRFKEAIDVLRKVLSSRSETLNEADGELGKTYEYLAICFMDISQRDSVPYYLHKAELVYKQAYSEEDERLGYFYNNAAILSANLGDNDKALEYYLKALNIFELTLDDSHPTLGIIYSNMGNIYSEMRDFERAIESTGKAREIAIKAHDIQNELFSTFNLSSYYVILGQYDQGLPLLKLAQEICRVNFGEEHIYYTSILDLLSEINIQLEEFAQAQANAVKSLQIKKSYYGIAHVEVAQSYFTTANAFQRDWKLDSAFYYAKEGLKLRIQLFGDDYPETANSYFQVGDILLLKENLSDAENNFNHALAIYRDYPYSNSWILDTYNGLGTIARKKSNFVLANHYFLEGIRSVLKDSSMINAYPRADQFDYAPNLILVLQGLIQSHMMRFASDKRRYQSDLDSAFNYGNVALDYLDAHENFEEKGSYIWSNYAEILYGFLVQVAYESYQLRGEMQYLNFAWDIVSRMKYSALRKNLESENAIRYAGLPDSILNKEELLKSEMAHLRGSSLESNENAKLELARLETEYQQLLSALSRDFPQYYQLKYGQHSTEISEIQKSISDSTQVIQYLLGEGFFYVMSITKDSSFFYERMSDSTSISAQIDLLIQSIKKGDCKTFQELSLQMSQLIFKPFIVAGKKDIIVIPHAQLYALNFEYLLLSDPGEKTCLFQELPYAIRQFNFRYVYLPEEILLRTPVSVNGHILAVAPGFDNEISGDVRSVAKDSIIKDRRFLTRLPWAVETAEALHHKLNADLFIHESATEHNIKKVLPNYGILHFGTHAEVDDEDPMLSRLVLTKSSDTIEDDFLFAYEIYSLDIHASLVSLTACETGIGKLQNGEGMLSMARAFRYAGCPSIAMSLWKIDDQSSAAIMQDFYNNLNHSLTKDRALR